MSTAFDTMDQPFLIALLRANRSQEVLAYAQRDGWHLVVRAGKNEWVFSGEDEAKRLFSSLDDLRDYLHGIAAPRFLVDISGLDQSATDPGTLERLREAQAAAKQDEWIRQQVQESLGDPSPSIPNSIVKERAAARRAELLVRLEQEKS